MYWEETIELIKRHGEEPKSTYPNAYNESDESEIYKYECGALSTSYIHFVDFPEKLLTGVTNIPELHSFKLFLSSNL